MNSRTTERFRTALERLPVPVRRRAGAAYALFRNDPHHASLRFKQVHPTRQIYSVRIGLGYRALGVRNGDELLWFWIGDRLLSALP